MGEGDVEGCFCYFGWDEGFQDLLGSRLVV
jgi:hypothetical protein